MVKVFFCVSRFKEVMVMILNLLILAVGFFGLIKGADLFVDGSAGLARNFHVPGLIIGLTIVALGTSAPELAVSTSAAMQGSNEIALSNVVGSNIFNLLVVLGVCALIHPVPVDHAILRRDFPVSIASTVFVMAAAGAGAFFDGKLRNLGMEDTAGTVTRAVGLLLITAFMIYIGCLIHDAKKHPEKETEAETQSIGKCACFILLGIALIVGGGQAVVYSAKEIARAAGMTETLIGLTIVAAGTSLPELVTSIVAAKKEETGLAVGNAIGSNIFNLMFILGVSALIHPVTVNLASLFDMVILIGVSALTLLFAATGNSIDRKEGAMMVAVYIADLFFAILR